MRFAAGKARPDLSVVIATLAPDAGRFRRVLNALGRAVTASGMPLAEVVVVRNGGPPIPDDVLAAGPILRLIDEERPGIAWARAAGISACGGKHIVFVDDDTVVAEDYLAEALKFARMAPSVGVFGGRIVGEFAKEPPAAIRPGLPFLALRDMGSYERRVEAGEDPDFDVPGAGMVLRRDVALAFRDMAEAGRLAGIGRTGASLASGDDTVCCRLARRMGLSLAYAPRLRLTHIIPETRLEPAYLRRLVRGIGASAARIDLLFDGSAGGRRLSRLYLLASLAVHVRRHGWSGGRITSSWHLGYRHEATRILGDAAISTNGRPTG